MSAIYRTFLIITVLFELLSVRSLLVSLSIRSAYAAAPTVWTAPSLSFVDRSAAPALTPTSVKIYAAKGEYESFQIGIRAPAGGLTNINVAPATLVDTNGGSIDVTTKTLYREQYVYINKPVWGDTNKSLGAGWYPDGLIPFANPTTGADLSGQLDAVPFSLSPGQNAAIWVDVLVPRTAAAGTYQGSFTITSSQGNVSVPVTLTVWNFMLPVKPALLSSFQFWEASTLAANQELLRNRISPLNVGLRDELSLIDDYGLSSTHIGFWSRAGGGNCNMPSAPSVSSVETAVANHQSNLKRYAYTADEIYDCTNLFPTIKEWGKNLHLGGSNQLITMVPNPQLFDDGTGIGRSAVDIWVVLPWTYDSAVSYVNKAIAKGDQVWSYNTIEQDTYSPKWVVGYAPINWRIQPGFINQSLGLTGLLYWRVDQWSRDPWNNVTVSNNSPGEGMFVYPGDQVGLPGTVVASMRLKWLRDGADDYDYIQLLKDAGQSAFALKIARQVGPDWSAWTRDTALLESKRIELGNQLSEGGRPDTIPPSLPTNLTASAVSSSQINLSWTASTDNVGVTGYDIYRGGSLLTSVPATSYKNTGLAANTAYSYQVIAKDAAGNPSVLSSSVSAITQPAPTGDTTRPP